MAETEEKTPEQEQGEKVLEEGSYAAMEDDDNSIDVSNEAYIGVDPMYQNSAEYDGVALQAPLATEESDDEAVAAVEQRAKASEEALTNLNVNRAGYTPGDHRAGLGTSVDNLTDEEKGVEKDAKVPGKVEDKPEAKTQKFTPPKAEPTTRRGGSSGGAF